MPSKAKFIQNNSNLKYICNICSDEITPNKIIGLGCDPSKHIFCYDCIYDWYNQLKNQKYRNNYTILNMCPICRKNGGLLPFDENKKFVKGLHYITNIENSQIDTYENKICGYKLCSKNGFCKAKSNNLYGKLCGKHHKNKEIHINPEKLPNECGVKLKTKNGYCKSKGCEKYNGHCGIHKNSVEIV